MVILVFTLIKIFNQNYDIQYIKSVNWNLQFLHNVIIIKTLGTSPSGIGNNRLSCLYPLLFFPSKIYISFGCFFKSIPDEGYSRNTSYTLN